MTFRVCAALCCSYFNYPLIVVLFIRVAQSTGFRRHRCQGGYQLTLCIGCQWQSANRAITG